MISFVTNSQFLDVYDGRWVGMNMLDNATAATIIQLSDDTTVAGARLELFLTQASEMLMAAAAVGARYSEDDIRTYGGNLVIRIVSDLAAGLIQKRRMRAGTDEESQSLPYAEALKYLEQLRQGERIFFNVPNVPEAGLPTTATMQPRVGIDPPTLAQQAGRYFGYPAGNYWNGYPGCGGGFG